MAMQYFEQTVARNDLNGENMPSPENWKSVPGVTIGNPGCIFDCNICLDSVQDPVVTLCGHLFCWPCIYKWLQYQTEPSENGDQQHQQCPVCKAEVSQTTLVPLYGRGQTTKPTKDKAPHLGIIIPRRPLAPACSIDTLVSPMATPSPRPNPQLHHPTYQQQLQPSHPHLTSYFSSPSTIPNLFELMIGTVGDARNSGNPITSLHTHRNSYHQAVNSSPRVRRHVMEADKSLSRIWVFLVFCIFLCFLLF